MWLDCVTELDTPILIFGYEVEDIMVGCTIMVLCNFLFDSFFPVIALAGLAMWSIKKVKKGRPPGFIIHMGHQKDIIHMPGVLSCKRHGFSPVSLEVDG